MKKYCEKWDSYYESDTGEWLESKCTDPECEYCKRPDKHSCHTQQDYDLTHYECG